MEKDCAWMWRCGSGKSSSSGAGAMWSTRVGRHVFPLKSGEHANQAKADLLYRFIEFEQGPRGRGIETTTEPERLGGTMEVAARRTPRRRGLHELQTGDENRRTEKIDDPRTCRDIRSPQADSKESKR